RSRRGARMGNTRRLLDLLRAPRVAMGVERSLRARILWTSNDAAQRSQPGLHSMRAYVLTTGIVFGLLALAHLWRIAAEGLHLLTSPLWVGITVGAGALSVWAWRLLRQSRPT